MLVIADASPLSYLIDIGEQHLLAAIFTEVYAPGEVIRELTAESTPHRVRAVIEDGRLG